MESKRKEEEENPELSSNNKYFQTPTSELNDDKYSKDFTTISGVPINHLYGPDEIII